MTWATRSFSSWGVIVTSRMQSPRSRSNDLVLRNCATKSSAPANGRVSRNRAMKSTAIGWPYKSPSNPIRWTSNLRACSPKVGFGPMFAAPGHVEPSASSTSHGVDAVAGHQRGRLDQVGGWEAERSAALRSRADDAAKPIGPAEQPGRGRHVAGFQSVRTRLLDTTAQSTACRPTTAKRNAPPAAPVAEQLQVAGPAAAEAEVESLDHGLRRQLVAEDRVQKLAGLQSQQFRRGPQDDDVIGPGALQQLGPVGRRRQQRQQPIRGEQGDRVRVEHDGHRRTADRIGRGPQSGDEGGMPEVNAVEIADGHRPAAASGRRRIGGG